MTISEEILADGPEGYWTLTSDLNDSSGNGNHLTTHIAGTIEQGYYGLFGQYGTRGTAVYDTGVTPAGGDWTIEFIVEREDPTSGPYPHGVVWDGDEDTGIGAWASLGSTGYLKWTDAGTTYFGYQGEGVGYHFIAVCSGGTLTVYRSATVEGAPALAIDSTTVLTAPTPSGSTLKIGNAGGGMFAHVAYYDSALSEARVEAHMTGGVLLPTAEPVGDTMDPYAVDGPIGSSTPLYGYGWGGASSGGGSGAISSGKYVTTEGGVFAHNAFADFPPPPASPTCIPLPTALSVEVTLPSGFDTAGSTVALGWNDGYSLGTFGAIVYGDTLSLGYSDGTTVAYGGTATVDVTAGAHTLSVWYQGGASLAAWWDGTLVSVYDVDTAVPWLSQFIGQYAADPCYISAGFALYENTANDSFTFGPISFLTGSGEYGGLDAPVLTGGLVRVSGIDNNLYVGGLEAPELTGGLQAPVDSDLLQDVHVGGLDAPPLTGGLLYSYSPKTFPPALPITTPGYRYGPPSDTIGVAGYVNRKTASFSVPMNAGGSGEFEILPPGPTAGDAVGVTIGGEVVFTGYAEVSNHEVAVGEEDEQTISVALASRLEQDFINTVVWPDVAADEPDRVGKPAQDDRAWNWHSDAGTYSRDELVRSVGGDNGRYGTDDEVFAFPDNWPDPYSKWMWDRNPDAQSAPAGWVYFRVHFGLLFAKDATIHLCAWDYATLSIDGQQFIEADQPGATYRHDLSFDWDYHLCTIAAYTEGGKAGVNCSIMPREKHGFTPSVMNSRGGWEVLSYPKQSLRFTTGHVLVRLIREAKDRGAPAGDWDLMFDRHQDSAGNAWPTDESVISTRVGMSYWDVLNMLAEDRIDFKESPSGKKLYAYVKGEPPRTVSSPWTAGATLSDRYVTTATR